MLRQEHVQILIYRLVPNLYLAVGIVVYPLPVKPCLDYYRHALTDQELCYNPIYPTLLPAEAAGELLPVYSFLDLKTYSKTVQLNR